MRPDDNILRTRLKAGAKTGPKRASITSVGILVFIEIGCLALCSPSQAQSQPRDQVRREYSLPEAPSPSADVTRSQQQSFSPVNGQVFATTTQSIAGAHLLI